MTKPQGRFEISLLFRKGVSQQDADGYEMILQQAGYTDCMWRTFREKPLLTALCTEDVFLKVIHCIDDMLRIPKLSTDIQVDHRALPNGANAAEVSPVIMPDTDQPFPPK